MLATVATLIMSFLTCLLLLALSKVLRSGDHTAAPTANAPVQHDLDRLKRQLKETNVVVLETSSDAYLNVTLHRNALYRLHSHTSYQEVATTDRALLTHIAQQLDAQGIEYEVFKNKSETPLLRRGEWIASWGGILYLPLVDPSF